MLKGRFGTAKGGAEKFIAWERNSRFLGAKAPRNDKNKGITMAHLKVRPVKASLTEFFRSP